MEVRIKKLSPDAVVPAKAHATDAGFDLVAVSRGVDVDGAIVYGTGLAFEIPEGYVGLVFPRSSIAKNDLVLSNCVGVIDAGYRGEVMAKFKPSFAVSNEYLRSLCTMGRWYNIGDRIAQLIILPIPEISFTEASELSKTERGEGGYGSSGK